MRTVQEIRQRINQIGASWDEICEKAPDIQEDMQDMFLWELAGLYWVLGYGRDKAIDYARGVLDLDPIDRS